jgi:hypothetical protein
MAEPVLKSEQEVLARFHELRQSVSTLFSKLNDIETGARVFLQLWETAHATIQGQASCFRVGLVSLW